MSVFSFTLLEELVANIMASQRKHTLIFAYNSTGKTRLSMKFKGIGKAIGQPDTLYFNAFTEDLFFWDNDIGNDMQRVLRLNIESEFFYGLQELEMDNKIRQLLLRYADFNFLINYEEGSVKFIREEVVNGIAQNIEYVKISRGEESIFIWCFFLAIAQLAIDKQERYGWVKYLYIDDPVSSLDDNNTIAIAHHLASMLKVDNNDVSTVISTHHALFFNVLCNEFKNARKLFLKKNTGGYEVKDTTDTPFIYHVSLMQELKRAIDSNDLYTYHFSILRSILEKSANFHGFDGFSNCLMINNDDEQRTLHTRMVNILNHGGYSLFEPREMSDENKTYFRQIFENFIANYKFNDELFVAPNITPLP